MNYMLMAIPLCVQSMFTCTFTYGCYKLVRDSRWNFMKFFFHTLVCFSASEIKFRYYLRCRGISGWEAWNSSRLPSLFTYFIYKYYKNILMHTIQSANLCASRWHWQLYRFNTFLYFLSDCWFSSQASLFDYLPLFSWVFLRNIYFLTVQLSLLLISHF